MKWVKFLIISSMMVFQFAGCSLDSSDDGISVTRMKDGNRGLPVPTQNIPHLDVTNTQTQDWGRVFSLTDVPDAFRLKLLTMMQTSSSDQPFLGSVSPMLHSLDGTGVAFKGRMNTNSSHSLASGIPAYLEALKSNPAGMQMYIGIFDSYVGQWQNGATIEPYSFYFGALNSGFNGKMAFNYQVNGDRVIYVIYMADNYGEIRFDGTFPLQYNGTYTEGVLSYRPLWQGSNGTQIQIGNYQIGTCHLFRCS